MSLASLKKALKEKKVILGTERALKLMKNGKVTEVFVSSNCPKEIREQIEYYSGILGCKVNELDIPNTEMGAVCKKPFSVNVICY